MLYLLYKLIQVPLRPEVWLLAGMLATWLLLRAREPRVVLARRIAAATAAASVLLGTRPLTGALLAPLERAYPPVTGAVDPHDAVVVLGGGSGWLPDGTTGTLAGTATSWRVVCAVSLLRQGVAPRLIVSASTSEASLMRDLATDIGASREAITVDDGSRTTSASAVNVAALVGERSKILLVTSALHEPRSAALFRKQGFEVTPAPCDYMGSADPWTLYDFIPSADSLEKTASALHEYAGLAAYRIAGRL